MTPVVVATYTRVVAASLSMLVVSITHTAIVGNWRADCAHSEKSFMRFCLSLCTDGAPASPGSSRTHLSPAYTSRCAMRYTQHSLRAAGSSNPPPSAAGLPRLRRRAACRAAWIQGAGRSLARAAGDLLSCPASPHHCSYYTVFPRQMRKASAPLASPSRTSSASCCTASSLVWQGQVMSKQKGWALVCTACSGISGHTSTSSLGDDFDEKNFINFLFSSRETTIRAHDCERASLQCL